MPLNAECQKYINCEDRHVWHFTSANLSIANLRDYLKFSTDAVSYNS